MLHPGVAAWLMNGGGNGGDVGARAREEAVGKREGRVVLAERATATRFVATRCEDLLCTKGERVACSTLLFYYLLCRFFFLCFVFFFWGLR